MEENKNIEKNELDLLLQRGVSITLQYKSKDRVKFWQFWKKGKVKIDTMKITFKEPTLAVLDRVSRELLNLNFDEGKIMSSSSDAIEEGRRVAYSSCKTMAKIISIFALNEQLFTKTASGYEEDTDKLNELTQIVMQSVKPSIMQSLLTCLTSLSNIPAFINSIRLTAATRTTRNRIE